MIYIIGIGPGGDVDYLTLNAYKKIKEEVNTGIYIGEMIGNDIKSLFMSKKLITGNLTKETVLQVIEDSHKENTNLAILMPGDSTFYSGHKNEQYILQEYVNLFNQKKYDYEIIPGITALNAICAKLSIDLTSYHTNQNVYITSIERIIDSLNFNSIDLKKVLSTRPNIVLYQSYRDWDIIKELLISENYSLNTRVIFAYKVSWADEITIDSTLGGIDLELKTKKIDKHTIILILPHSC